MKVPSRNRCYCWAVLLIALILAGCSLTPDDDLGSSVLSRDSYVINGKRYRVLASAKGYSEVGDASWYGQPFHGRKTSSGERYNMYDMTAAHKTLPLGTWVEVTHLDSRRKVVVRVNDRGPFVRGRIIDLSYAAAKNLGVVGPGTMRVRVTALGTAQRRRVAGREEDVLVAKPSYQEGRFAVQVGAFADPARAKELAKRMESEFGSATIQRFDHPERVLYRVHVADVGSLDKAQEIQGRLEQLGFDDCFVVAR